MILRPATFVLAVLFAGTGTVANAQATGSIDTGIAACVGSACGDVVHVSLNIPASAVGHRGGVYVAILPVGTDGKPIAYEGAYATQTGWQFGSNPLAYGFGNLPIDWHRDLPVPGGICAMAQQHGYKGSVAVFVGYGLDTGKAPVNPVTPEQAQQMLAKAQAVGNPELIKQVQAVLSNNDTIAVAMAAQQMLTAHTVWSVARLACE